MIRGRTSWVIAASLALAGAGVASAQPSPAEPSSPASTPASEAAAPQGETLTPEQQLQDVQDNLASMQRTLEIVRQQLAQAREAKDVVKVLCLSDKSSQLDVALTSAKERADALRSAIDRKDSERALHEYTVLGVLNDRVKALAAEANQCIGEETGFVGDAVVSVDIDPSVPDTDPSFSPVDPFGGSQATGAFGPDDLTPPPQPVSAIE